MLEKEVKEVVIEDDDQKEEQVEVPLKQEEEAAKPSAEEQLASKIREDFDKLYGSRIESLESRLRQSLRQGDQLRGELTKITQQPPREPSAPSAQQQKDELDVLVEQGQWKEAVSKLAAVQAQEILKQERIAEAAQQEQLARQTRFEQSKQTVIGRYPDLDPETGNEDSDFSKEFNTVLNEHPWLLKEPLGPTEAMRMTEDRLTEKGIDTAQFRSKTASVGDNKEVIRRQRANLSGLPTSRVTPKPGTITLTKSEKEFIDYWGISPEDYAKNKQLAEAGGVIEG